MKKKVQKYVALGTAVAASAFLVSCSGDDGKDGTDGADGTDGTDGTSGLTMEELTNTAFIAGVLRMTLDPEVDVLYPGTPEVYLDFASDQLAFFNNALGSAEGLLINQLSQFGFGPGAAFPQVRIVDLVAPADGTFTIAEITGDTEGDGEITIGTDIPAFTNSSFVTEQIIQNTYLGSFETEVGIQQENVTLSQNAPAVILDPNGVETMDDVAPAGYFFVDAQQQVDDGGLPVIVQTTDDARDNLLTLPSTVVAVRFREIGSGPETDVVFAVTSPVAARADGENIDLTGFVYDLEVTDCTEGYDEDPRPEQLLECGTTVFATGQFRLDIDSTQGGDASNLPIN